MKSKKQISLEVTNEQLDALEDLLFAELAANEKAKAIKQVKALWQSLVSAYEEEELSFPLRLYSALEAILDQDRTFYFPVPKQINVVNSFDENEKLEIKPSEVICIVSEDKNRKKTIYLKETNAKGEAIKKYSFNNNVYPFKTLSNYLDPLSHYLLKASKKAIVNVAFYELTKRNSLQLNFESTGLKAIEKIKTFSPKGGLSKFLSDFHKIKEAYKNRILLQKKILGYRSSDAFDS